MNFSKRQNEFCDIPGFDASKGERIVKALQKLWAKIQYLEQNRTLEKKSRSEASCSSKNEDLTLTDVQYKLLLLQLQYVRSLLKKKSSVDSKVFENKISEDEQKYTLSTFDRYITRESELHPNIVNKPHSEERYAMYSPIVDLSSAKESDNIEDNSKNVQVIPDNRFSRTKHSTETSTAVHQRTAPSSSKPHYHLKLDDVPFILAASSTASHSVFANVQNIIAMMKSHNKALCGPKPNVTKSTLSNAHSANFTEKNFAGERSKPNVTRPALSKTHSTDFTEKNSAAENSQEVTKLMNDLSRDLCALAQKQQKLAESIDASQMQKHEKNLAKNTQNYESKISCKQVENDGSRSHRSHSESEVKLHAEVKKMPKIKEKDFVKYNVYPKQSSSTVRSQSSNLSIMDRRKLLRSLQNFKKHLSEEDISWN